MNTIKVVSVNISEKKGTIKKPVDLINLTDMGVEKDAHAGDWHRQVSLLGKESIEKFEIVLGRKIEYGEFAENITTEGIVLHTMNPGEKLIIGDVELEITQIGKECHGNGCAIFSQVGKCVMPKEGVFAKVIKPGKVKAGDSIVSFVN
ncbi:MAG: MOSC domain-containing protein [Bacteroidales bacterium]|jgi:MOSC domain-containing protein YiiM|nr:MOSC domain-containing protein [Bacteroidales bacterium]